MIRRRTKALASIATLAGCWTGTANATVPEDVAAVLRDWGQADAPADRNGDHAVNMRDLVLALMGERERPGQSIIETRRAGAGTTFIGIRCEQVDDSDWQDNGYAGLSTYRVYAAFTEGVKPGVLAVFGLPEMPLVMSSSDGQFHNDTLFDSLTAPQDLRTIDVWGNQWDTYVTIGTTEADGDATNLSPGFGMITDDLSRSFEINDGGWFVTPIDEQHRPIDDRVLLAQFSVQEGETLSGLMGLLLADTTTVIDLSFVCGGGGPELGACCLDDGATCHIVSEQFCLDLGGVFRGVGSDCVRQIVETPCHPGASAQHCVRILSTCPKDGAAPGECEPGLLLDAWVSPEDIGGEQSTYHDFGASGQAIPADFFGVGSDPVTDLITFKPAPIGGEFGDADTILRRSADPFDRCALPSEDEVEVEVELVALSLDSSFPLFVTYDGGPQKEAWDVSLGLSLTVPAPGTLRATKTTCNGGTYSVEDLRVQPQFTFTKVSDPKVIRIFDTGIEGIDPVSLSLDEAHWVSDIDPGLVVLSPFCTDFHPGLTDAAPPANCDCNGNELRDLCDIETGESLDCNADAVPDECEIAEGAADCNKNGILDSCECPGDVQSDCLVGYADIIAVLRAWGPCDGCTEDATHDGIVGAADVNEILQTWGPCGSQ